MADMSYDGQQVCWNGRVFRASSGLPELQNPNEQCTEGGPIPQGVYSFLTSYDTTPARVVEGTCKIVPSGLVQELPEVTLGDPCNDVYSAWGRHRVRLKPVDAKAAKACQQSRDGFYIHDSTKGYSHGCIEVDWSFFYQLRLYRFENRAAKPTLTIHVQYVPGKATSYRAATQ